MLIASHNQFQGGLYTAFHRGWSNPYLRIIRIDHNFFNGSMPSAFLLGVPALEELDAAYNEFTGSLPGDLSWTDTTLRHLNFAHNQLTGSIPTTISNVVNLQYLNVSGNFGMTGTIPSQLGLLGNLTLLDVTGTSITGTLPDLLCRSLAEGNLTVVADWDEIESCSV